MCKEDIRLARAASPGMNVVGSATNSRVLAMKANAERYSLGCELQGLGDPATPFVLIVEANYGKFFFPIMGLSIDHPADTKMIVDVGLILTYDIYVTMVGGADAIDFGLAESQWTMEQKDI